jgi:hypothetical protein
LNQINALLLKSDKAIIEKKFIDYELQLYLGKANMENSTRDIVLTRKLYEWTLQALNKKNLSTIIITQKALPDSTSNTPKACLIGGLLVILFWCCFLAVLYFIKRYSQYLKLLYQ